MPKRVGPEAKIIALFTALPDDSKRIVLEIIKSQTVRAPKSQSVPSAGKRSPRNKSETTSAVNSETEKETASNAVVCAAPNCGQTQNASIHDRTEQAGNFHVFRESD